MKNLMFFIVLSISACAPGKYDCCHLSQYDRLSIDTRVDAAMYCISNPMQDFTKDKYGRSHYDGKR